MGPQSSGDCAIEHSAIDFRFIFNHRLDAQIKKMVDTCDTATYQG
jgi:hypothetical protein